MSEASNILELAKQYWYVIVIIVLGIIIFRLFSKKGKALRPTNRAEYERLEFIKANHLNPNPPDVKYLYKGDRCLGKIEYISGEIAQNITVKREIKKPKEEGKEEESESVEKEEKIEGKKIPVYKIVARPTFIFGLPNIFAPYLCIVVSVRSTSVLWHLKRLWINPTISFNYIWGIYYEIRDDVNLAEFIQEKCVFKTDLMNTTSVYFVESQKQATYDPQFAHELTMKEKELQIELARKRGKMSSI